MTSPATLYAKALPIAYALARDRGIPGGDRDDVRQEARIALWTAARVYRPELGPWPAFARLVVRRRLDTAVRIANGVGRNLLTTAERELDVGQSPELDARLELAELLQAVDELDPTTRRIVLGTAAGYTARELAERTGLGVKAVESRLWRARKALRARIGIDYGESPDRVDRAA